MSDISSSGASWVKMIEARSLDRAQFSNIRDKFCQFISRNKVFSALCCELLEENFPTRRQYSNSPKNSMWLIHLYLRSKDYDVDLRSSGPGFELRSGRYRVVAIYLDG